ncbi:MAG: NUDIX domain-containing protein [Levilactobacillus sp.]|jgi:8-oxo-dGTP diphosphatase|uniref:8-oxo-dGTP diphosphatase n=1 Tax=Levilactobacillus sp. TaxID=2767919 RepID=UPI0025851C36|nr:NUDIX domain-containing protein [Levilactobacillus sp.]MCH4123386.1 NUDIX domain-containing protein [Levilactobacillus sp.]MCI1552476.1 NUDIX domain-containing protein [Levilactobacillus sp.]MCI1599830.1 NUDIX domain-containing protein [Levilactobacillus sp.]MCI1606613.1 NUDIX domain-containing protein [Levilactobacillus sp.]
MATNKTDRTQPVELVTMIMVTDPATKRVLVEDKVNVPWKAGHSFPGGHVEIGESCAQAAIREVFEETGLRLKAVSFCGTCEWFDTTRQKRKLGLLYRGDDFTGTLKASAEGQVSWLPLSEMTPEKSAESMAELLRVFNREVPAVVSDAWNGPLHDDQ